MGLWDDVSAYLAGVKPLDVASNALKRLNAFSPINPLGVTALLPTEYLPEAVQPYKEAAEQYTEAPAKILGSLYGTGISTAAALGVGGLQGDPLKYFDERVGTEATLPEAAMGAVGLGPRQVQAPTPAIGLGKELAKEYLPETYKMGEELATEHPYLAKAAELGGEFGTQLLLDPALRAMSAPGKLGEIGSALGASFIPGMAQSALQGAQATVQGYQEQGLTPEVFGQGLQTAMDTYFAGMGLAHAAKGHTTVPDDILARGLGSLVEKGEIDPVTAQEVMRVSQPEEAQGTLADYMRGAGEAIPATEPIPTMPPEPSRMPQDRLEQPSTGPTPSEAPEPVLEPSAGEAVAQEPQTPEKRQEVSPLGFRSILRDAVDESKGLTASGENWTNYLKKRPGVKEAELKWTGLDDYLAGKERVTKSEIQRFLDENEVRVEERIYNNTDASTRLAELEAIPPQQLTADQHRELRSIYGGTWGVRDQPRHEQYTEPDGENYRELLLTLPISIAEGRAGEAKFTGGHYPENNILVHVRFNERTDSESKKVLFLEEIQSDWGESARDKGLVVPAIVITREDGKFGVVRGGDRPIDNVFDTRGEAERNARQINDFSAKVAVPPAPFVTKTEDWSSLAMKRMIRWAAEHGYDKIAWTTGEMQNRRYPAGGEQGAKIAHGMEHYYDKILPQIADKLGRKFGAKVGETKLEFGVGIEIVHEDDGTFTLLDSATRNPIAQHLENLEEAKHLVRIYSREAGVGFGEKATVQSLNITPEMRKSVMEKGLALFQEPKEVVKPDIADLYDKASKAYGLRSTPIPDIWELYKQSVPSADPQVFRRELEALAKRGGGLITMHDRPSEQDVARATEAGFPRDTEGRLPYRLTLPEDYRSAFKAEPQEPKPVGAEAPTADTLMLEALQVGRELERAAGTDEYSKLHNQYVDVLSKEDTLRKQIATGLAIPLRSGESKQEHSRRLLNELQKQANPPEERAKAGLLRGLGIREPDPEIAGIFDEVVAKHGIEVPRTNSPLGIDWLTSSQWGESLGRKAPERAGEIRSDIQADRFLLGKATEGPFAGQDVEMRITQRRENIPDKPWNIPIADSYVTKSGNLVDIIPRTYKFDEIGKTKSEYKSDVEALRKAIHYDRDVKSGKLELQRGSGSFGDYTKAKYLKDGRLVLINPDLVTYRSVKEAGKLLGTPVPRDIAVKEKSMMVAPTKAEAIGRGHGKPGLEQESLYDFLPPIEAVVADERARRMEQARAVESLKPHHAVQAERLAYEVKRLHEKFSSDKLDETAYYQALNTLGEGLVDSGISPEVATQILDTAHYEAQGTYRGIPAHKLGALPPSGLDQLLGLPSDAEPHLDILGKEVGLRVALSNSGQPAPKVGAGAYHSTFLLGQATKGEHAGEDLLLRVSRSLTTYHPELESRITPEPFMLQPLKTWTDKRGYVYDVVPRTYTYRELGFGVARFVKDFFKLRAEIETRPDVMNAKDYNEYIYEGKKAPEQYKYLSADLHTGNVRYTKQGKLIVSDFGAVHPIEYENGAIRQEPFPTRQAGVQAAYNQVRDPRTMPVMDMPDNIGYNFRQRLMDMAKTEAEGKRLGIRTIFSTTRKAIQDWGFSSLLGHKINPKSWDAELALQSQFTKAPFELHQVVAWDKNGNIIYHNAWSSGLSNRVNLWNTTEINETIADLEQQYRDGKIAGWADMHNHPGGSPQPSGKDLDLIQGSRARLDTNGKLVPLDGYQGHVITDHQTYSIISPSTGEARFKRLAIPREHPVFKLAPQGLTRRGEKFDTLDLSNSIKTMESLADRNRAAFGDERSPRVFYLTNDNRVSGIEIFPFSMFEGDTKLTAEQLTQFVQNGATRHGAAAIVVAADPWGLRERVQALPLLKPVLESMPHKFLLNGEQQLYTLRNVPKYAETTSVLAQEPLTVEQNQDAIREKMREEAAKTKAPGFGVFSPKAIRSMMDAFLGPVDPEMAKGKPQGKVDIIANMEKFVEIDEDFKARMGAVLSTMDKYLTRDSPDAWDRVKKEQALRNAVLNTYWKELDVAHREYLDTKTVDSKARFEDAFLQAAVISKQLLSPQTEWARSLAALREARTGEMPRDWTLVRRFVESLKKRGVKDSVAEEFLRLFNEKDIDGFQKLLMEHDKLKWSEKLLYLWKSGLLSGPQTRVANNGGNATMFLVRESEQIVAPIVDLIRAKLTGIERERFVGEAWWSGVGLKLALEGDEGAIKTLAREKAGFSLHEPGPSFGEVDSQFRDAIRNPILSWGKMGQFLSWPFKGLKVDDDLWKQVAFGTEAGRVAFREAKKAQFRGEITKAQVDEHTLKTLQELLAVMRSPSDNPGLAIKYETALKQLALKMKEDVFQAPMKGVLGSIGQVIQKHPSLQLIVPFYQTPVNIAIETIKRTPLGLIPNPFFEAPAAIPRLWRLAKAGKLTGAEADAVAQAMTGTALMASMVGLAMSGRITGGGPDDENQKKALQAAGITPYSIKVGDKYIGYSRFEPLASIIGMAADIGEAIQRKEYEKADLITKRAIRSIGDNMTNKTFLSGLEGFGTMLSDPIRYGPTWAKQMEGSLVPNVVGRVAQAIDPTIRKQEGLTGAIQARIPWWSQSLPQQISPTGDVRVRPGPWIFRFLPVTFTRVENERLEKLATEMEKIDYAPSVPRDYLEIDSQRVKLTKEELYDLQEAHRRAADAAMDRMDRSDWDDLSKTKKQEAMEKIFTKYRRRIRERIKRYAKQRVEES